MKQISDNLQAHLQSEVTTLTFCWKITLSDSSVLGFTSHDDNIIFDGVSYISRSGFTLDQYAGDLPQNGNSLEILGIIDSDFFNEVDIRSGRFDNAEVEIFALNYVSPTDGKVILKKGIISEITNTGDGFAVNIKGISDRLNKTLTQCYSPLCRAKFGDDKCKIDAASYTYTGTVTNVTDERNFADTSRTEQNGYFNKGIIKFTSGSNAGFSTEIKISAGSALTLSIPFPNKINIGDAYQITAGCDKSFPTCISKFSNSINFRGEPDIPGINKIFKVS